ncbi:hypothetical protein U1Q18_030205 [Sarracenia purpurea var. burkii]
MEVVVKRRDRLGFRLCFAKYPLNEIFWQAMDQRYFNWRLVREQEALQDGVVETKRGLRGCATVTPLPIAQVTDDDRGCR